MDKIFEKLGEFASSGKLWPILLGVLLLCIVAVSANQYNQVKRAADRFNAGKTDDETVALCQKLKQRNSRRAKNADMHDLCCCMLCSIHLERGEEDAFFDNLNALKTMGSRISWRVHLLLAAYLADRRYLELSALYKEQKSEDLILSDWIVDTLETYEADRLDTARERITKTQVLEILDQLV